MHIICHPIKAQEYDNNTDYKKKKKGNPIYNKGPWSVGMDNLQNGS